MFNNYNPWQSSPYSGQDNSGYGSLNRMNSNVVRVTSLEEAIMKSNSWDSEMVYFHQDKNEFYTVRVDANGNKSWQTFSYNIPTNAACAPVTREEYDALVARVAALEPKEVPNA